jgi:nicotinamidase-related amidase
MDLEMETQQNIALLIVDIQNDYFEGGTNPLVGSLEASIEAKRLLAWFRLKKKPVIHVQHIASRPGATFFVPRTKGAEIHSNVKPLVTEKIVVKHFPNSFRETGLHEYLQEEQITHLVICGMMTHMCVDSTTRAAKDLGYTCTLVSDACATKNLQINGNEILASDVQPSFLAALSYFYAEVKTTNEFIG